MKTLNDELKAIISRRNEYFKSIEDEELQYMDDEEIEKYYEFKNKYDKLSMLEKDLWFLNTQMKKVEIARLYSVSKPYISKLLKEISIKLMNS